MSNTDRDSMLERWAVGMEKLEQYYEGLYGPPATPATIPDVTNCDGMLEAIADGLERAQRNINKRSTTYHNTDVSYIKTVPAHSKSATVEIIGGSLTISDGAIISAGVTSVVSKDVSNNVLDEYDIPAEVQALDGYGWGTSQASNYIDFEAKKFVKCVKKMVLNGTEDGWGANSSGVRRYFALEVGDVYNKNIVTTDIPIVDILYSNDVIGIDLKSGKIYVRPNNNGWSADQFKTWLASNNITVYIGLQSPEEEIDISDYLTNNNLIQVEGGGTLTFRNSNNSPIPVPSTETFWVDVS